MATGGNNHSASSKSSDEDKRLVTSILLKGGFTPKLPLSKSGIRRKKLLLQAYFLLNVKTNPTGKDVHEACAHPLGVKVKY